VTTSLPRAFALVLAVGASLAASAATPALAAVDPGGTLVRPVAKLASDGRSARLTGQVTCATCRRLTLAVTISQRSGALAQGGVRCRCRSVTESWTIDARVRAGSGTLHAGRAKVCAWVVGQGATGKPVDAYQWCRVVRLS
jgi:hypothetical protein